MRILVTGATGFIGRHVVPRLLERGHAVTAVSRDAAKAQGHAWFPEVRYVPCDVHALPRESDPARARIVDSFGAPEAVLHLAWPGLPNYRSPCHVEQNLTADYAFLRLLVARGVGHLLVTGTCFEYGAQSGSLSEETPTAPIVPYGQAKDSLRRRLQALQQERRFVLQWVRLFYMFGAGQHPHSLLAVLDRAIDEGESVFNMTGGRQLRDYLPVEEVARRLALLIEHPENHGVVNCCSGKPISVLQLVEKRVKERGAKISLNVGHYPYPEYEPMAFWGNCDKLDRWVSEWNR